MRISIKGSRRTAFLTVRAVALLPLCVLAASGLRAQTVTTTALLPTQGTYIDETNTSANNSGQSTYVVSVAAGPTDINEVYLQYDLASVPNVVSAKLRFFVNTNTAAAYTDVNAYEVGGGTPNTWTSAGLNYSNSGSWPLNSTIGPLGTAARVNSISGGPDKLTSRYYEIDVTSFVKSTYALGAGSTSIPVSLILANVNSTNTGMLEIDGANGPRPPQLIITTAAYILPPSDDCFIDQNNPGAVNDTQAFNILKGAYYTRRPYLKFDLTTVSNIVSAKLRIYVLSVTGGPSTTITAYGISGTDPTRDGWSGSSLTYTSAASYPPGTSYNATPTISNPGYYEIDVTTLAQASAGGPMSIILMVPPDGTFDEISSSVNGTNPPQLIIGTTSPIWAPGAQETNRGNAGATGTTYYIDNVNGADGNTGTLASPWKTVGKVNSWTLTQVAGGTSIAGDAFLFLAGDIFTDASLTTQPGAPGARVIYGSYDANGTGSGVATIQAPSGPNGPGSGFEVGIAVSDWTEIRDLKVIGTSVIGSYAGCAIVPGGSGIESAYGQNLVDGVAQDVLIENLLIDTGATGINGTSSLAQDQCARWAIYDTTVRNIGGTGVYVYGDNFVLRNCLIHDWCQEAETIGVSEPGQWSSAQHGVYSRARQLEVYGSEFYRYAPSIYSTGQPISPRSRDNVIEGNRIHDVANIAIGYFPDVSDETPFWGWGTSIIRYNTFWNIGTYLIYGATNGGNVAEHWVAYNNTIEGGNPGIDVVFAWLNLTNGATAVNNAIIDDTCTSSYTKAAYTPPVAGGTSTLVDNTIGPAATLDISSPPVGISPTPVQWMPVPSPGSPLIAAGTTTIDSASNIYIVVAPSPTPTPPNIGSW